MSNKTLALIGGLILLTVVLLVVAFRNGQEQVPSQPTPAGQIGQEPPTIPKESVLSFSQNPINVGANGTGSVDIVISTGVNEVSGLRLELQYDPGMLSKVTVTPSGLFESPLPLYQNTDTKTGRVTSEFALPTAKSRALVTGTGTVATVTFTKRAGASGSTTISLLPETLVSAKGVSESVMKSVSFVTVNL